jgi:hypothetical protein
MQGSNRWADKSTSFHATTKSATSGFTSPALAAKKANQKNLRPTSRNSPKHNVLDALIRSENANWRNNAKQDHLGVKRKIAGGSNSTKVLFGRLRTEELSCREKQDRTEKRNQNPSWGLPREQPELAGFSDACRCRLSHDARRCRPRMVDPIVIVVGICERGQDEGGGY